METEGILTGEVLTEVSSRALQLGRKLIPIAAIVLMGWVLIWLSHRAIRRAEKLRGDMHLSFFRHLISGVIVLLCVILALSSLSGVETVWRTLLSGTAVLTAVLAFVAQDVIKDLLAGLMLSIHRPFSVGDRIVLEDGTAGVVLDITMRHVILAGIDSQRMCIPNSKISAMRITDFITPQGNQSIHFQFSVGYESDLALVKRVVTRAIEQSEYTVPGHPTKDGGLDYGPVYFLSFADSALIMGVTVYYPRTVSGAVVTDDVNTRVRIALRENKIEIPYNYVTVVTESGEQPNADK